MGDPPFRSFGRKRKLVPDVVEGPPSQLFGRFRFVSFEQASCASTMGDGSNLPKNSMCGGVGSVFLKAWC